MKLLIAYDGSPSSDAVLADLTQAALPARLDAMVITVRDLPPVVAMLQSRVGATDERSREYFREEVEAAEIEAHELADNAAARLRTLFPQWSVDTHAAFGSPHRRLIEYADQWPADLVALGSRGRGALARTFLGSVAQACLHHCTRSIRICRAPATTRDPFDPPRLLLATDGSSTSKEAARGLAARQWPAGTTVRVLSLAEWTWLPLDDMSMPVPSTTYDEMLKLAKETAVKNAEEEAASLNRAGIDATPVSYVGYPRRDIVDDAQRERIDMIFMGATGHNLIERILIGSVAASVAIHAECSVEIVRPQP
jgi:nucleotide-binding universal stress UspA family protein